MDLNMFGFSVALQQLKDDKKVCREGWNGKGMWLKLVSDYEVNEDLGEVWENDSKESPLLPWIGIKTADNKFVPWLASQTDLLAEDWMIAK